MGLAARMVVKIGIPGRIDAFGEPRALGFKVIEAFAIFPFSFCVDAGLDAGRAVLLTKVSGMFLLEGVSAAGGRLLDRVSLFDGRCSVSILSSIGGCSDTPPSHYAIPDLNLRRYEQLIGS